MHTPKSLKLVNDVVSQEDHVTPKLDVDVDKVIQVPARHNQQFAHELEGEGLLCDPRGSRPPKIIIALDDGQETHDEVFVLAMPFETYGTMLHTKQKETQKDERKRFGQRLHMGGSKK